MAACKMLCQLGEDATLCATGKSGKVETTALYHQLYEAAGDIKPKNISIDTLSRAFAGNEIDRVQVYAFAMHMQALAMVAGGSVTVLAIPACRASLRAAASRDRPHGMAPSGSGNTSRAHQRTATTNRPTTICASWNSKKTSTAQPAKPSSCATSAACSCRWPSMGTLDKLAAEQAADHLFLELLDKFQAQGRNVSHLKTANSYAPTMFGKDPKAKAPGIHKALAEAMERLFAAKKIKAEEYGPRSRLHHRIARCDPQQEENAV